MATGRHWEWRAFGQAPHPFVELFDRLPLAYPEGELWLNVTDDYLWVPDCRINVKLRRGIEDGLKLKRFEESKDGIELWREDSKELYPYAKMDEATFSNLADALRISLPPVPAAPWDRDKVIAFLELAEPRLRLIRTEKKRQTRRLGEKPQALLIEIAELTAPERIVSLGLEDDFKLGPDARSDEVAAAMQAIQSAIESLGLSGGGLKVMNYLDALGRWATGKSVREAAEEG